jgi:hypothetical protein
VIPLGLPPRDIALLAREARAGDVAVGPLVVSGLGAAELAAALGEGAAPGAVVVRSDPADAAAVIRVLDGHVSPNDREVLRAGARAGIPLLAVLRGDRAETVPYVLATDVVAWPKEAPAPTSALLAVLATALRADVGTVAARVPALRPEADRAQAFEAAGSAAALVFLRGGKGPLAPALTLHQARLLRRRAAAHGGRPPGDAKELATTVGPELGAAVATGLAARGLVRRLPFRNRVIEAAVAFGGTLLLGRLPLPGLAGLLDRARAAGDA